MIMPYLTWPDPIFRGVGAPGRRGGENFRRPEIFVHDGKFFIANFDIDHSKMLVFVLLGPPNVKIDAITRFV